MGKESLLRKDKSNNYLSLTLIILTLVGLQAFFSYFYLTLSVTLNNKSLRVVKGITLTELLAQEKVHLKTGDLYRADGKLLKKGGGYRPSIKVNNKPASLKDRLRSDSHVLVAPGKDMKEEVLTRLEAFSPLDYRIVGSGAFVDIGNRGEMGVKEISYGSKSSLVFGEKIVRNPAGFVTVKKYNLAFSSPVIALTFDDGPNPIYTPQILDILKSRGVVATFFILGAQADKYPQLLEAITSSKSTLANHSYSHRNLERISITESLEEINRTEAVIEKTTKNKNKWFRPPGGNFNGLLVDKTTSLGYHFVLWNIDPRDWTKPPVTTIAQTVISQAAPGAIILLHDGGGNRAQTVAALPTIIDSLKAQGYTFVTLNQLIEQ